MLINRKNQSEYRTLILFTLYRNDAFVALNNFLNNSKPDPCAFVIIKLFEALKYFKDFIGIHLIKTNAIVTKKNSVVVPILRNRCRKRLILNSIRGNCYFRRTIGAREFECIADQVLKNLVHLTRNSIQHRKL